MLALSNDDFRQIIKNTPMIAIAMLPENPESKVLLRCRANSSARGLWFALGGRLVIFICRNSVRSIL